MSCDILHAYFILCIMVCCGPYCIFYSLCNGMSCFGLDFFLSPTVDQLYMADSVTTATNNGGSGGGSPSIGVPLSFNNLNANILNVGCGMSNPIGAVQTQGPNAIPIAALHAAITFSQQNTSNGGVSSFFAPPSRSLLPVAAPDPIDMTVQNTSYHFPLAAPRSRLPQPDIRYESLFLLFQKRCDFQISVVIYFINDLYISYIIRILSRRSTLPVQANDGNVSIQNSLGPSVQVTPSVYIFVSH